jgi:hypothetical protein
MEVLTWRLSDNYPGVLYKHSACSASAVCWCCVAAPHKMLCVEGVCQRLHCSARATGGIARLAQLHASLHYAATACHAL